MTVSVRRSFLILLASCALAAFGCGRGIQGLLAPNRPPEIEITGSTPESSTNAAHTYRVHWKGLDPDGRVDHYLYAIDPRSVDATDASWRGIGATTLLLSDVGPVDTEPHVFAVCAVDDQGAVSKAAWFSYSADNLPPSVTIVQPQPHPNVTPIVPPVVTIRWNGIDPDGIVSTRPVKYKFRLFTTHNPDYPEIPDFLTFAISNPDSLRKLYAPSFAGWDSTSGDTTETRYTNLIPNQLYLFVITAFDELGDYDPVFSQQKNMLRMAVAPPCTIGPLLCLFGRNFDYCYSATNCEIDPSRYVTVEMAADQLIRIAWRGIPPPGANIKAYRWVLDPLNLEDETPRSDEEHDWYHWSQWSPGSTEAVVGPFPTYETKRQSHLLIVQVEDTNGLRSFGAVNFIVVPPTFTEDLLVVDDTRLTADAVVNGVVQPPRGAWPTAAELDTFLYARGGFPWKSYPAGTLSSAGIFNGYRFDTLGTRSLRNALVPLSTLSSYRTVVWLVDDVSSAYTGTPNDLLQPITALRHMSSPGQSSTLATYMQQGGRVWLMGGGAAYATLAAWGRRNTPPDEFTNADGELVSGRFMYDFAHWQSALMIRPAYAALFNIPANNPPYPNAAPGRNWTGQGTQRDLSMPDYSKLQQTPFLAPRMCATDPPSPLRDCGSFYIINSYSAEFMGTLGAPGSNLIQEDANPDPDIVDMQSTLDTLYFTVGGTAPYGRPVMTYYHGFESPPMVFSGFPLWYFRKTQAQNLSDFVLGDIFRLTKTQAAPVRPKAAGVVSTNNHRRFPLRRP